MTNIHALVHLEEISRDIKEVENNLDKMEQILLKVLQDNDLKYKDECITFVLKKIGVSKGVIRGDYKEG